ncbi:MAG: dihydropteroate synthase [Gemmatimonadota bacterium]
MIALDRPIVMGILNLTPDSFSDGGELSTLEGAVERGERMVAEGAGILDVGGESTRPGADLVDPDEEIDRILPVVTRLASRLSVPISIDTRKARVAQAALAAGASIVNDVSALGFDPDMVHVVAGSGAGVVLMHMRGSPLDMQERAQYQDLVGEVVSELRRSVARAEAGGIRREAIVVDPGIGFAKTAAHSLRLLGRLERLGALGLPILVGPSRKSFLGEVLDVPPRQRAVGTAAACVLAYRGGARIFRVHDVKATREALAVAAAVEEA